MSKGYGVYTKVTHWCNRFQIACALSWNIPKLCAIKVKTGHIPWRGTHHLPLPTLCVGLHPMAQENYHWEQLAGFDAIPDEEFTSLNQSYSLLKAVFTWAKLLNTCGMRWSDDFVFCISSLPEPINLQQLIEISCRCWVSYCMSFTQVKIFISLSKCVSKWPNDSNDAELPNYLFNPRSWRWSMPLIFITRYVDLVYHAWVISE